MLNLLLVTLVKYWDEPHVTLLCIKLCASVAGKQSVRTRMLVWENRVKSRRDCTVRRLAACDVTQVFPSFNWSLRFLQYLCVMQIYICIYICIFKLWKQNKWGLSEWFYLVSLPELKWLLYGNVWFMCCIEETLLLDSTKGKYFTRVTHLLLLVFQALCYMSVHWHWTWKGRYSGCQR